MTHPIVRLGAALFATTILVGCGGSNTPSNTQNDTQLLEEDPKPSNGSVAAASSPKVQEGMDKIQAQDFEAAKAVLTQAAAENPDDPQAAFYLGVANEGLGDVGGARTQYEKAIQLDAKLTEAYVNLSAILMDAGEHDRALELVDTALGTAPKHPGLLMNRALALEAAGKKDEAVVAYGKAVEASPDNDELRYAYGEVLASAGKKDAAIAQLRKLVNAGDIRVLAATANLLGRLEAFADCIAVLDKAIEQKAAPDLYVRRGVCRHGMKDEAGAKADYEKAIELDESSAPAHFYLGQHLKGKDDKKACASLKKAAELGEGGLKKAATEAAKKAGCK